MTRRSRIMFILGLLALATIAPSSLTRTFNVPMPVNVATAKSCLDKNVFLKKENSHSGIDQWKGRLDVWYCTSDNSRRVVDYKVALNTTYLGLGWQAAGSESSGHWKTYNGKPHGARVEVRTKHIKLCTGIGPLQACLKSIHPSITVEMRADGGLVVYGLNDAKVVGVS